MSVKNLFRAQGMHVFVSKKKKQDQTWLNFGKGYLPRNKMAIWEQPDNRIDVKNLALCLLELVKAFHFDETDISQNNATDLYLVAPLNVTHPNLQEQINY